MTISSNVSNLLNSARPENVRFIKLGRKSSWWPISKKTDTLRIGFKKISFDLAHRGKWNEARDLYAKTSSRARASDITRAVNQVKEFFELPESTLWITIEDGDVWWGFAKSGVEDIYKGNDEEEVRSGARLRYLIDGWRNKDINGNRLRLDGMTTKITKVASFQETICKPDGAKDILHRIRCEQSEQRSNVSNTYGLLRKHVGDLLDQLHQDDFELLIELIFSSSGWQRISAVGGTQKTLDMALKLPTTGENCFVQVKSQTSIATFKELVEKLSNYSGYSRMFFVYHTPDTAFENKNNVDRVTIWSRYEVAEQAIAAGLVQWIMDRTT